MKLITEQKEEVFAFSTFFYPKLVAEGYNGVSKWMKDVDIFNKQLVLIPLHLGMHWCLATVDYGAQQFCYYDSLNGTNTTCLELLRDYIQQKSSNCKSTSVGISIQSGQLLFQTMSHNNLMATIVGYLCVCMQDYCLREVHCAFLRQTSQ